MKKTVLYFFLLFVSGSLIAQTQKYDLVIVGGTPGGIMTAIAASREGKTSLILERTDYIGGLPVNGLGATDIGTRGATTGLFKEFVDHIYAYYKETYGENSPQAKVCSGGYHFEPNVAAKVFDRMLQPEAKNITILRQRQFDALPQNIQITDGNIQSIRIYNRQTKKPEEYTGKIFIDATYEGDLGAAAGVPFSLGREGQNEYNEIGAGKVYKLWEGPEIEGSTHEADKALQAYNYRLCLTNDPANRLLPAKPAHYKRSDYVSLIDDVLLGRYAGVGMLEVTVEMQQANKKHLQEGGAQTQIPGDPWGIAKISNQVDVPNRKTDSNNQHLALISTDLPDENYPWPTAGWKWRDQFAQRLQEYTLGLLWFAQNDPELPESFRNACREWGLSKDEYQDNGNFPRQVYVREGRRLQGEHIFTANDARPAEEGKRPPLYANSITASHYALDSHAVHKREGDKIALDGFFSYSSAVYTVPYGVILPKNVNNLLIPVPASATHVGFSTLRMEPCWMALGQAAGTAASVAIDRKESLQKVNVEEIQSRLLKQHATLIYFKDIKTGHPDFEMTQYMGLKGYLPDWNVRLDDPVDADTAREWTEKSGISFNASTKTRGEILKSIYTLIK
ncbi:MAG: FAD-dependent oxidoreductase [Candidatus Symbiothrix sp.]|jgi:hypothetical protein|nr:FAD-dependent oxidoreductase [Candidatus Symbiothrix sp.]